MLSDDGVRVLDWESAVMNGMPVWDWLHYNVQRKKLVDGLDDKAMIDACRNILLSDSVQSYLNASGLKGREDELLGSYLYFTGKVQDYPRSELIDVWLESSVNGPKI